MRAKRLQITLHFLHFCTLLYTFCTFCTFVHFLHFCALSAVLYTCLMFRLSRANLKIALLEMIIRIAEKDPGIEFAKKPGTTVKRMKPEGDWNGEPLTHDSFSFNNIQFREHRPVVSFGNRQSFIPDDQIIFVYTAYVINRSDK